MKPSAAKSVQVDPSDPCIDPELYNRVFARSTGFLDTHRCSVLSTELPIEFLFKWRMPTPADNAEAERFHKLILSDYEGVLIRLPMDIFYYVCQKRFPSDDEGEAENRFGEAFFTFQTLLCYIYFFHTLGKPERIRPFDLFDLDAYDELYETLPEDFEGVDSELDAMVQTVLEQFERDEQ